MTTLKNHPNTALLVVDVQKGVVVLRTGCPRRYFPAVSHAFQTVFYHVRHFRLRGRWTVLFTAGGSSGRTARIAAKT